MKRSIQRVMAFALVLCLSVALTTFAEYKTIPYGEINNRVRKIQNALKTKGYYKGPVDGVFGQSTRNVVSKFQNSVVSALMASPAI